MTCYMSSSLAWARVCPGFYKTRCLNLWTSRQSKARSRRLLVEWARIESSLQISNISHLSIFSSVFLESWPSSLKNLATCGSEANCFKQGFLSYTRKNRGQCTGHDFYEYNLGTPA